MAKDRVLSNTFYEQGGIGYYKQLEAPWLLVDPVRPVQSQIINFIHVVVLLFWKESKYGYGYSYSNGLMLVPFGTGVSAEPKLMMGMKAYCTYNVVYTCTSLISIDPVLDLHCTSQMVLPKL